MRDPLELLRDHLRQRRELGDDAIFLQSHTAAEMGGLLTDAVAEVQSSAASTATTDSEISRVGTLEELCSLASGCPRCRLAATRRTVVFGEGNPTADVLVIGEAPGAEEDRSGRPFVGPAGKLLELLLAAVGFSRERVYICNVLKCRPPGNRNPNPDEVEACRPYLLRQVELIGPRVILACGTFAAQTLLRTTESIGKLRGGVHRFQGIPVVPMYHPAALLRNAAWVRTTWEDLQRLRAVLDQPPLPKR